MTDVRGSRLVRILQDPAIGGDLLLVAVALAAKYDFSVSYGGSLAGMGAMLWSNLPNSRVQTYQVMETLRRDTRTYKPPPPGNKCTSPMLRRTGLCGQRAVISGYIVDWATGEETSSGGCSRHADWARQAHRANRLAKPADPPLPYANHGGALRVHFPLLGWEEFWARLAPSWRPWRRHPERTQWPKPTLRLMLGDGGADEGERPLLSVVPIGGQP